MSKIKELKENSKNNVNVVDIISRFCADGKSKYIDTFLRILDRDVSRQEGAHPSALKGYTEISEISPDILEGLELHERIYLAGIISIYGTPAVEIMYRFSKYNERGLITKKDISTYNTFKELRDSLVEAQIREEENDMESQIRVVYEDDEWIILRPLTYAASKKYGANTKLCTASRDQRKSFDYYSSNGILIYCIAKTRFYKAAIHKEISTGRSTWWNDEDNVIFSLAVSPEALSALHSEIETFPRSNNFYLTGKEDTGIGIRGMWAPRRERYMGVDPATNPSGMTMLDFWVTRDDNVRDNTESIRLLPISFGKQRRQFSDFRPNTLNPDISPPE